jgi:anti-sigma B factor antagonist
MFSVEVDRSGKVILKGELDLATVPALEDAIAHLTSPGCSVILDLTGLTFMDGSGVRCLIKTWKTSGQRVVLLNPSRAVRRLLELIESRSEEAWLIQEG